MSKPYATNYKVFALHSIARRATAKIIGRRSRRALGELFLMPAMALGMSSGRAFAQDVTTWHGNNARTGVQNKETVLTPANVRSLDFGKVFSLPVLGDVYAEPLFLSHYTMADGQSHNILLVATQRDYLYAFDADGKNPAQGYLWRRSLLGPNETWLSYHDVGTDDIAPDIGVTGTPVIDRGSGTIYVVAKSKTKAATPTFFQRLHAVNLADGSETRKGPSEIKATTRGLGDGGTTVSFSPLLNNQRPALLLAKSSVGEKSVVIAWSSHGDNGAYHGWVISYDAGDISRQTGAWTNTPNGSQGGIWMSGGGPSSDEMGQIFLAGGNGTFDANTGGADFGDSALRLNLSPSGLKESSFFTPADQNNLNAVDNDMGTSAVMLLPKGDGPVKLAVTTDKSGTIYLLDGDKLGGFTTPNDSSLQSFLSGYTYHSSFAFFKNKMYGAGDGGPLQAWTYDPELVRFVTSPQAQTSTTFGCVGCNGGGSTPSISANGGADGIVWALDNSAFGFGAAVLHAYDPADVATEFYNSTQGANSRDAAAIAVKFSTPTIAAGKVYVGGRGAVTVFGLLSKGAPAAEPVFSLSPGSYPGPVTVRLTDATPDASIYYTVKGANGTAGPLLYTGPITVSASETITATALAPDAAESAAVSASYTILPPKPPAGEVVVSLTKAFDAVGIFTDGKISSSPGIDAQGSALSAQVLGKFLQLGGVEYLFGSPDRNDVVLGGSGVVVVLPSGMFHQLNFLGLAVNGSQLQQTFTVTYTDNSTQKFSQSISDWFTPQAFLGEVVAIASPYRDLNTGVSDARTFNLYAYSLALDSAKTVRSVTLPNNVNVAVYAMALAK